MKKLNDIRYIIPFMLVSLLLACTHPVAETEGWEPEKGRVPITFRSEKLGRITDDLDYAMYIFSREKASAASYVLSDSIHPLTTDSRLKVSNDSLSKRDFRFLFIATPKTEAEIRITDKDGGEPALYTAWENIRLKTATDNLSLHNYYDVKDMTGEEILRTDSIHGNLVRAVGQMVFDISKVGTGIEDVQLIDTSVYSSVFDRIYKIEVIYSGCTSLLAFGEGKELIPQPDGLWEGTQVMEINEDAPFKVALPRVGLDTLAGGTPAGGRVKGLCLLPSADKVYMKLTFSYYDTTPICDLEHSHTASCFEQKTLILNIPVVNRQTGIAVRADAYTVNKIGIRYNRLIDVGYSSGINITTEWD